MADSRPNILWYCTDQQRFDTIGRFGQYPGPDPDHRCFGRPGRRLYPRLLPKPDMHPQPFRVL